MSITSATATVSPVEVGAWTLEYLGPGFRVEVRVSGRGKYAQVAGWISPAIAARIFLLPLARPSATLEAVLSTSGRFSFDQLASGGGYRLAFMTDTAEQTIMTPPFWV